VLTTAVAIAALIGACSSDDSSASATDDAGTSNNGDASSPAGGADSGGPIVDSGSRADSSVDSDASSACSGVPPTTITLPLPTGASGTWISTSSGGALTGLPHPSSTLVCTTCHSSCGSGSPNTIIGYDHSNPDLVCNYCHDPGTKVVDTKITTRSMANYHSSVDSQVCSCCHDGTNNTAHGLAAEPPTPIVPSSPACTGTSSWQLVYPTLDSSNDTFSGGQFFGGT
jgi:hypothetical protein